MRRSVRLMVSALILCLAAGSLSACGCGPLGLRWCHGGYYDGYHGGYYRR